MKRIIVIALIVTTCVKANSQLIINSNTESNLCGSINPSKEELKFLNGELSKIRQLNLENNELIEIPIKIHLTVRSYESSVEIIDEVIANIDSLNKVFETFNMKFISCGGINLIDNLEYGAINNSFDEAQLIKYNVNDAINIYYINALARNGYGLNATSNFPSPSRLKNQIILRKSTTQNFSTLVHEMGHFWNLYHTFERLNGDELVNGTNCRTAGDLVCDTPADPIFAPYSDIFCLYAGTGTDSNGDLYNPLVSNFMSYYFDCRNSFTAEQKVRMYEGYLLRSSILETNLSYSCIPEPSLAATNISIGGLNCSEVVVNWQDNSNNETGYIIEYSSNINKKFLAAGTVEPNQTNFTLETNVGGMDSLFIRIRASNSNAILSEVAQFYVSQDCFCEPSSNMCFRDFNITSLSLSTDDGVSLFEENFNSSLTCIEVLDHSEINLSKSALYRFEVTNNTYNIQYRAWIDWNLDDMFSEEELLYGSNIESKNGISFYFSVPFHSQVGKTRIRIIGSSHEFSSPCPTGSFSYDIKDVIVSIVQECNASYGCVCIPVAERCYEDVYVSNVSIKKSGVDILNNSSTCSFRGYSVFFDQISKLTQFEMYDFFVERNSHWDSGCIAWIDFNRNDTFEDSEKIFSKGESTWSLGNSNFMVPGNALPGVARMRVMMTALDYPNSACIFPSVYGEVEDYVVEIVESTCPNRINITGTINSRLYSYTTLETSSYTSPNPSSVLSIGANNYVILNPGFESKPLNIGSFLVDTNGCN